MSLTLIISSDGVTVVGLAGLQRADACDPSWRSTRDGLIAIPFTVSIVAFILGAATISALPSPRTRTR